MTLALVPAPALGDGILAMVLAHNAHRAGQDVVVLHPALPELAAWYPWARIEAPPDEGLGAAAEADALFVGDPVRAEAAAAFDGPKVVFGKGHWMRDRPYLDSLRAACVSRFDLPAWDDAPGTVAPGPREPANARVALHPTSGNPVKAWPPARWLALAEGLQRMHFNPVFLVAPDDEARWRAHAGAVCPVEAPGPLDAVAAWLRNSLGCIATDSGIAHLASAVGCPTVAVFRKASAATFWGPAWGRAGTVAPRLPLPAALRRRVWPRLISPERVVLMFDAVAMRA